MHINRTPRYQRQHDQVRHHSFPVCLSSLLVLVLFLVRATLPRRRSEVETSLVPLQGAVLLLLLVRGQDATVILRVVVRFMNPTRGCKDIKW